MLMTGADGSTPPTPAPTPPTLTTSPSLFSLFRSCSSSGGRSHKRARPQAGAQAAAFPISLTAASPAVRAATRHTPPAPTTPPTPLSPDFLIFNSIVSPARERTHKRAPLQSIKAISVGFEAGEPVLSSLPDVSGVGDAARPPPVFNWASTLNFNFTF